MAPTPRNLVFISYSHKDKKWLDDLCTHLKPYLREGSITAWSDRQIQPGSKWFEKITSALENAKVAVLLVTPNFLASDFIHQHELTPLLTQAEAGGTAIHWIHVRASSYQKSPVHQYQAVIDPAKPLAEMKAERDAAWVSICKSIEHAVNTSPDPRQKNPSPPVAGHVRPALNVIHADVNPVSHRPLLHELERSSTDGQLQNSLIGPILLATLGEENNLQLVSPYDPSWITTGVRLSDEYFVRVRSSAGQRDWQKDFAQTAAPALIGVARSLQRSGDAQAVIVRLCDVLAKRLRLRIIWPDDPDECNDLKNSIYHACIQAQELECDWVRVQLKRLSVVGPE